MIPNVVKGSGFRGLTNYLLVGRKNATIVGGNMAGRDALELTREFGICRRLRPGPAKPVMHHTLSFADGEDPGDIAIGLIAEKYIQRLSLENHQWVAVVHRDKAHVHVHLAVNRIGLDGSWWNATRDFERTQVVAGQVEVEFGLVRVPRMRLRSAIREAVSSKNIQPPAVPPPPPLPGSEAKHVLGEMRAILEAIPHGLSAPEWMQEVEARGLIPNPSIGGSKISGFTMRMPGHRSVKLSDVHRSLSWPKLLTSGRVVYDADSHFEFIAQRHHKEPAHVTTSSASTPSQFAPGNERDFDPESGLWTWEWQPVQSEVVDTSVGTGLGPDTADVGEIPVTRVDDFGTQGPSEFESSPPGGSGASDGHEHGPTAAGIRGHEEAVEGLSFEHDIALIPPTANGPEQHVLGSHPERGSHGGPDGDSGLDAGRPDAWPTRPLGAPKTPRELAQPLGGSLPHWSGTAEPRDRGPVHRESDLGWRGVPRDARDLTGSQVDFEDLALPSEMIPAQVRKAAKLVVGREAKRRLPAPVLKHRTLARETLWEETQKANLSKAQYRQAKVSLQGVQHHLDLARAIILDLTLAAKQGLPFQPPKHIALEMPSTSHRPTPEGPAPIPPHEARKPKRKGP